MGDDARMLTPASRACTTMLLSVAMLTAERMSGQAAPALRHTPADARFMQDMIAHHAQALAMTALLPSRTSRREMRLLAQRIEVSQRDEIGQMGRWLVERGEKVPAVAPAVPGGHAAHAGSMHDMPAMGAPGAPMPGMLTPAQMDALSRTRGSAFDRLFLTDMIRHHDGAIRMVATLLGTTGAGQESEVFRFASDVDSDQRAEIGRMRALLGRLSMRHRR